MTTITLPRATVEQALEAMRCAVPTGKITLADWHKSIAELEAVLAQQVKHVAWMRPWPPVRAQIEMDAGADFEIGPDLAQQAEPVEPVAGVVLNEEGRAALVEHGREEWHCAVRNARRLYTAPPQRKPLTDEEILDAVGWERAEMYMKLTPNFPVDEAKKETLKNARAVERALEEKNRGR